MRLTRRALTSLAAGAMAAAGVLAPVTAAHAATGTYSLVILPDQGESAIYNFVNSATKSIDVTIYELRDTTLVNDLVAKEKAGIPVRVIMDAKQTSVNSAAYSALSAGGVGVTYSSSAFVYTHQKTITVDGAKSYISTGNFDTTYYATSRDYGVFDTDANDVNAIEQVFAADYAKTSITPSDGDDLVWSPTDSQTQLLGLINGAQHTLDVQEEEFGDTALINAIVADEQRGVTVRVVAENENNTYTTDLNEITAAGGKVTTYTSSTGFYIHAKAIVADYGTSTAKAFAGSENFSDNSLNDNRELGLIVSDPGVVSGLESTITADFNKTSSAGVSVANPGSQSGTVGTAASLQVSATDTAGGSLSYSATGLPAGLSINASTGLVSGTPTTAGTSNATVTATDSTGPSGSASFSWTVNPAGGNTVTVTNPGSQSGTVGTAASLQVSASDSASGQTLSYSATGLPAGLSINSATGLVSGTPTTAGTASVTVTAKDSTNAGGSATFSWTVNPASGGGCTSAQLLGNPGFETGTASPWTASTGVVADSSTEPAHTGSYDAWLDGYGKATTDTLAQSVTLPTGCANYQLSYWLHVDTAETSKTTAYDTLKVQVLNSSGTVLGTVGSFSNLNHNTGYAQQTANLSAYAGQTVTLKFTGTEDSEYQTSFVIDDTAVNVS
ncbi:putative Ig domain-containing protein [Kitasatospora sp. NBC_01287]|uniref:putative Ig domain-containing protein n=1 Tax=Kitasatospora sp. NBC_01287 TaxID=2903573 RepID=UPI002253239F|nr:putative Ig domain-containing protein [Kitasatospora sp. NBC_01287]MCX4745232.1 putative Ig domain-containing protein [Kitasatospora sp. NBC_01287]